MKKLFATLDEAAASPDVQGVVVTGSGKYYSAGVDLSSMIQPISIVPQMIITPAH